MYDYFNITILMAGLVWVVAPYLHIVPSEKLPPTFPDFAEIFPISG